MKYNRYWLITSLSLGDGHVQKIRKSKNKSNLDIAHHYKHKDYVDWKKELLDNIGIDSSVMIKNRSGNLQYRVTTKSYIIIDSIRRKLYIPKKQFNKKYCYNLDDLSLALLWMDDGCLTKQKHINKLGQQYIYLCATISTEGFNYKSQENILFWLKYKFDIDAYIGKSRENYRICLNRNNTYKLIDVVKKHVIQIPSMLYKINTDF